VIVILKVDFLTRMNDQNFDFLNYLIELLFQTINNA